MGRAGWARRRLIAADLLPIVEAWLHASGAAKVRQSTGVAWTMDGVSRSSFCHHCDCSSILKAAGRGVPPTLQPCACPHRAGHTEHLLLTQKARRCRRGEAQWRMPPKRSWCCSWRRLRARRRPARRKV